MVDVMVAVPGEASAARKHESNIRVHIEHIASASEITGATMLIMCEVSAHMLARKVSVKDHVLACHLFVVQCYDKSIAQMT